MQLDLFSNYGYKNDEDNFFVSMNNGGKDSYIKYGTKSSDDPYYTNKLKDRDEAIHILGSINNRSYSDVMKIIQKAESEPNVWQLYNSIPDEFFIF